MVDTTDFPSQVRERFLDRIATALNLPTEYDNGVFEPVQGVTWARVEVLTGSTRLRQIGNGNSYRQRGRLVVTLSSPLERGEGPILAIAGQIVTQFRFVTVGDLRFLSPSRRRLGRSGAYWQLEVTVPWEGDLTESLAVPTLSVSVSYTGGEIEAAIRSRFATLIEAVTPVLVQYDNDPHEPPASGTMWVRWSILRGETVSVESGLGRFRTPGLGIAMIFSPVERGDAQSHALSRSIMTAFRAVSSQGISYGIPYATVVGRSDWWWQINVSCPFYADER